MEKVKQNIIRLLDRATEKQTRQLRIIYLVAYEILRPR